MNVGANKILGIKTKSKGGGEKGKGLKNKSLENGKFSLLFANLKTKGKTLESKKNPLESKEIKTEKKDLLKNLILEKKEVKKEILNFKEENLETKEKGFFSKNLKKDVKDNKTEKETGLEALALNLTAQVDNKKDVLKNKINDSNFTELKEDTKEISLKDKNILKNLKSNLNESKIDISKLENLKINKEELKLNDSEIKNLFLNQKEVKEEKKTKEVNSNFISKEEFKNKTDIKSNYAVNIPLKKIDENKKIVNNQKIEKVEKLELNEKIESKTNEKENIIFDGLVKKINTENVFDKNKNFIENKLNPTQKNIENPIILSSYGFKKIKKDLNKEDIKNENLFHNELNKIGTENKFDTELKTKLNPVLNNEYENIVKQIDEGISMKFNKNSKEMKLKLYPEELGEVEVKFKIENNVMKAQFIVENDKVKEAIENKFQELKQNLNDKGIQTSEINVYVSSQDKGEGRHTKEQMQEFNFARNVKNSEKISSEEMKVTENINTAYNKSLNSGLNILA